MKVNTGTLTLVATPIGNLGDITLRALEALKSADKVLCEDTRQTRKLLTAHGIDAKLVAYHDQNGEAMRPKVLGWLEMGERLALVSDAGMPLINDPGYKLVGDAQEQGYAVTSIPGASAVLMALQLSGLPTDQFYFGGFVPRKEGDRVKAMQALLNLPATLLFFEAPSRLLETLAFFKANHPDAEMAVARELTKRFEEVKRGTPAELEADYAARAEGVLGEIVLAIRLPERTMSEADLDSAIVEALASYRLKEAVQIVADRFGLPKNQVYDRALALKGE